MVAVSNGFEQGTNGSTITAAGSGGGADTAWDVVTTASAGSAVTYDNAHAKRGSLAGKIVTAGASGSMAYVQWSTTLGTLTTTFTRTYLWLNANPSATAQVLRLANSGSSALGVNLSSTGLLSLRDAANGLIATTTTAVPTGQWVRIETKTVSSATVGTAELRLYTTSDSPTATETISGSSLNTNTLVNTVRFGITSGGAITVTFWLDDAAVSSVDWLGPSITTVSGATTFTATGALTADGTATTSGGATLTAAGSLTAGGTAQTTGTTALAATGALSSGAVVSTTGAAAFTATGLLTSTGTAATTGTTALSGTGALAVSGGVVEIAGTAFTATGALTAAGAVVSTVPDNFADAQPLTGDSGSVTFSNVGATLETGEPPDGQGDQPNTVWFSFTAPDDGVFTVRTSGTPLPVWDSIIAVYTGTSFADLVVVGSDDDGDLQPGATDSAGTSSVTVDVTSGTTYWIQVGCIDDVAGPPERSDLRLDWAWVLPPWSQFQSWLEKPSIQGFRDNRRWSQAQSWEVHLDITPPVVPLPAEIPPLEVMRQSYVYPAPTLNSLGWPAGWEYSSSTVEKWANYVQVVIDYKTFSIFRGVPAIVESWSTTSPYTWGVATVRLPAFTGFDDHTAEGIEEGAECRLFKVNVDNSRGKLLFQGLVASVEDRSGGVALTVEMQGWLNSALLAVCQPNLGTVTPRDLATVIGETLDGVPSRRFGVTYRNATGILDQTRGSLDQSRLDFVTGRLAQATTEDGNHSYTVVMAGSRPSVVEKDRTTVAYTVRYGQPGITVDLSKDVTQTPNVIYGSGVDPESRFWRNTKYPKAHPDDSLPYPFNDAGNVIDIGTSDGDTDSGTGVSDWQRRVNYLNISPDVTVDGDYSSSDASACRTIQSHYGILVDGIVGPQTWDATFGVGSNVGDLNSAYVAPLAYVPAVEKHTYYASGAVSGDNPAYDNSVLRVETYIEYGENITKADAIRSAKGQIARDYPPGWVGEVTFNADPNECHRREIVADKVINLRGFQGSDVKLYIAEAVVDNLAGSVTCKVSEKALDLLSLAAVWQRDRDAKLDPARQAFDQQRKSRLTDDTSVQWDSEDICGVVPRAALYHGLWSVLRIPFAQVADLAQTILTTSSPASPFAVGVFGKPINASDLNRYVGNPLAQSSPWDTNADVLNDTYGLWMSWGSQDQPCGYYPKDFSAETAPPLTGRMKDTAGFHFASANPPWAWVAFYASSSCFVEGRFEFSVPN